MLAQGWDAFRSRSRQWLYGDRTVLRSLYTGREIPGTRSAGTRSLVASGASNQRQSRAYCLVEFAGLALSGFVIVDGEPI